MLIEKVKNIKRLIGENNFGEALLQIESLTSKTDEKKLLLIKRRLKENNDQFDLGIKSLEDFNVTNTRISLSMIGLLDKLIGQSDIEIASQFIQFGKKRLEEKDFISAKMYFDKAIMENNRVIEAYLDRGAAKLSLKEYHEAIVDFSIVIKNNPNNPIAHYNKGVALFQLGELEEACKCWKKVKELGFDIADEVLIYCY